MDTQQGIENEGQEGADAEVHRPSDEEDQGDNQHVARARDL